MSAAIHLIMCVSGRKHTMDTQLEFTTDLDHELGLVLVRVRGRINTTNAKDVSLRAREEAHMHGYGVLFDFRAVSMDASFADLYRYPREAPAPTDKALKVPRCSLLISKGKDEAHWKFFEDATRSAGVNDRLFVEDEKAALEWASGKTVPSSS